MDRKTLDIINSDRVLDDLRMQSEDLINNIEALSEEVFKKEADRIKTEIDLRMATLIEQYSK